MTPRVAVIVLTHNNFDDTVECLDSVLASDYAEYDLVLVDNGSEDGSIEKIRERFPGLHYQLNEVNLGVAGGRNSGWRYVRDNLEADCLLFLDNDAIVRPDTMRILVDCLHARADVAIACGKAYTAPPSTTIMSAGMVVNLYTARVTDIGTGEEDTGQYDDPGYVAACGGFCFMVRHDVFRECNGLEDAYNPYGFEDVDLSLRALKIGYRCYYEPRAVVWHKGCKIGRGYVSHYEKYKVRNFFRLLNRHATLPQKLSCAICIPAKGVLAVLRLVFQGELRVVASQFRGAVESALGRS